MPQMITHYQFGLDVTDSLNLESLGTSPETRTAFLLGNQGPDPFFFIIINPGQVNYAKVGDIMHYWHPGALLTAAATYVHGLEGKRAAIGKAFLAGLACHYCLDRNVHPLVYFWQEGMIGAGVGLTRDDEDQIHAEIERDIDEAVLFSRFGTTVKDVRPFEFTLAAPESVLEVAGEIMAFVCANVYGLDIVQDVYGDAVHAWRTISRIVWSPSGRKRALLAGIETKITGGSSIIAGIAHRSRAEASTDFDNKERRPWTDPFTGAVRTESLEDLVKNALAEAPELVDALIGPEIDPERIMAFTAGINFSGDPVGEEAVEYPEQLAAYRLVDNP